MKTCHFILAFMQPIFKEGRQWERLDPGQYVREQFNERLAKLKDRLADRLSYSPEVFEAIQRCGWRPSEILWGEYGDPKKSDRASNDNLEIVRILLREEKCHSPNEAQSLRNLDWDHRLFAVPLFVASADEFEAKDIVIGARMLNSRLEVFGCFCFDQQERRVKPMIGKSARNKLLAGFLDLLKSPSLQTVDEYLKSCDYE